MFKVVPLLVFALAGQTASAAQQSIHDAVLRLNQQTANMSDRVARLTDQSVQDWYQDFRISSLERKLRADFDHSIPQGLLPEGLFLSFDDYPPEAGVRPTIRISAPEQQNKFIFNAELVSGFEFSTWKGSYLDALKKSQTSILEPLRVGIPSKTARSFPDSVQVRTREVKLEWAPSNAAAAALEVDFYVTPKNLLDLARYFGTGYSESRVASDLRQQLGTQSSAWISLRTILEGWPKIWMNRFPAEKAQVDGTFANDVCHGTARQFFSDQLMNGPLDRATEASEWLLRTSYMRLPDNSTPEFGDYLYWSGAHSVRFILKDPNSGRWIGFSSYSESTSAYRVWWTDQDYRATQLPPPPPDLSIIERFDIWRPVREN